MTTLWIKKDVHYWFELRTTAETWKFIERSITPELLTLEQANNLQWTILNQIGEKWDDEGNPELTVYMTEGELNIFEPVLRKILAQGEQK